ncbi:MULTISPECIES: hypothetical protein [Bradyrhizobium]|uniref:hypothetical protein n=1 Tax=Bradyrhizobium TaxID=374 RepID=UPI00201239A7|nr:MULTISPECIES: hypothetical protein [Bradyrhizobium]
MSSMTRHTISILLMTVSLLVGERALAQSTLPGTSIFNPPPPPPPPPPKIEVPKIPQLDAKPRYNYKPLPRNSHGDRFNRCLDAAAAAGMSPADRGTFARSCANQ